MKNVCPTVLFVSLAAATMIMTTDAQDTYGNCATNFTVLENALLETSDNMYQLTTTFFHPNLANPSHVDVYYNFSDFSNQAHYIWSAASVYLIVAPPAWGYLSLYFGYVDKTRITALTLQLPASCAELTNTTSVSKGNFLFVLNERLRLYAKYYRSVEQIVLPDGFEARSVSIDEQRDLYVNTYGVKLFFSFVIFVPIIIYMFFACYVRGTGTSIRRLLKRSDHHSSQAALICVGQTFTLYVGIMDAVALSEDGLVGYMCGLITFITFCEFILFNFTVLYVVVLSCKNPSERLPKAFYYLFFLCVFGFKREEIKSWFVIAGFISPLLCLSSHIGFVIEGWASNDNHGTAVMLFHSLCFIYLFVLFQKMYFIVAEITKNNPNSCLISWLKENHKEPALNFRILICVMLTGMLIMGGILVYISYGFVDLPILRGTEVDVTHIYHFGQITFIFAVFFITYLVYKRRNTSAGVASKDMIKFWKYLVADEDDNSEQEIRKLEIETDTDRANALSAVCLFHLIQKNAEEVDHHHKLLSEIVKQLREERGNIQKNHKEKQDDKEVELGDNQPLVESHTHSRKVRNTTIQSGEVDRCHKLLSEIVREKEQVGEERGKAPKKHKKVELEEHQSLVRP